jgi:acyl-CoA synthetase (NDP forming)
LSPKSKKVGIDVVDTRLTTSAEEAAALSKEIGFPMVLKIASVDMVHKSDVGGVNMGLGTPQHVASASPSASLPSPGTMRQR